MTFKKGDAPGKGAPGVKRGRCWKGYAPTPGKAPFAPGSCRRAFAKGGSSKSTKKP